jgi:uncharacterized membrane protein YgcG
MIDREKVINGLTELKKYLPSTMWESINDALAMLKEQEHKETFTVIDTKTGEEADEYAIALHEDWAKHLCYCDMEGWAIENDGTLLLVDECGRFAYADRERFKVVWDA